MFSLTFVSSGGNVPPEIVQKIVCLNGTIDQFQVCKMFLFLCMTDQLFYLAYASTEASLDADFLVDNDLPAIHPSDVEGSV